MKKLVFLTGSGISAESGIPTFRDSGGLWENNKVEEIATRGCFEINAERSYQFYNDLREEFMKKEPSEAHKLIASLENKYDVTVITQNVDNLHEKAGSTNVIHLHGEITKMRAIDDDNLIWDWPEDLELDEYTEYNGHNLRPHIVLFGEDVPMIEVAQKIVCDADILVVIGTSLVVYPAAGLIGYMDTDKPIYYIDPDPGGLDDIFGKDKVLEMKATEGMKKLIKEDL